MQASPQTPQIERVEGNTQVAKTFDRRMTLVVAGGETRDDLHETVDHAGGEIFLVIDRLGRCAQRHVAPARADQPRRSQFSAERPRHAGPDERE